MEKLVLVILFAKKPHPMFFCSLKAQIKISNLCYGKQMMQTSATDFSRKYSFTHRRVVKNSDFGNSGSNSMSVIYWLCDLGQVT